MDASGTDVGRLFVERARYILREEYGPRLRRCLQEMTEEDLWWRPSERCNSAGNLVLHVCGNARQWIIAGLGAAPDARRRADEFAERGPVPRAELEARLNDTLHEVDAMLAALDPARLAEPKTIQGFAVNPLQAVFHVVEHFGQHLGQVIYLTKMRRDLDLRFYNL